MDMINWLQDIEDNEDNFDFRNAGHDAYIFLVDATEPMVKQKESKIDDEDDTFIQTCFRCIQSTMQNKIISSKKDQFGIVLFGTKITKNSTDFKHITVLQDLKQIGADDILFMENLASSSDLGNFKKEYGSSDQYSLHEALWLCQSMISASSLKLSGKKIFLMSCNDDPHPDDAQKLRQIQQKARDLNDTGITLDILPLSNQFNMDTFYSDILQMVSNEDSYFVRPSITFEDLLTVVYKKSYIKRSTGKINFFLGENVNFSITIYNLVGKTTKPSKIRLSKANHEEVKSIRTKFDSISGDILMPSDINMCQIYGSNKILFSPDEVKLLKSIGTQGIKLLGFKPMDSLKILDHVKPSSFIYPEDTIIQGSRTLFAALLMRCIARKVLPICIFKPRANIVPSLVALCPQEEVFEGEEQIHPPGFHVVYLPYADDIRDITVESSDSPSRDQIDIAKNIIKKLTLKRYNVTQFENPDIKSHWSLIETLALNRDEVEQIEDTTLPPYDRIKKKLGKLSEEFNDVFAMNAEVSKPAARRQKKDESSADNTDMASAVANKKVEKFTVDILKKFLQNLNVKVTGKKKADLVRDVYEHFEK